MNIQQAGPGDRPIQFRPDINALRALAVFAVVMYHFTARGFGGGFVGVDVFFVISGYLMTRIVVSGIESGNFSVWGFYAARARRIVPALVVMCAILLMYGWVRMAPDDFSQLGGHVAASIAFVSNVVYWRTFGYFDADAHSKWLLHTWSLSVEWQFYLAYPLMLTAAKRCISRPNWAVVTVGTMLVASLLLSVLATHLRPVAAFYLLPTRAWEMLAGGLVFLLPDRGHLLGVRPIALLGLIMIAASVNAFDAQSQWPGYLALLPVVGAACVIWVDSSKLRVLNNRAVQFFGECSYSIYLWHWPIVAALYQRGLLGRVEWCIGGVLGSVALGWASFRWVEQPTRRLAPTVAGLSLWPACAAIAAAGLLIAASDGAPQRSAVAEFAALKGTIQFPSLANGWCHVSKFDGSGKEVPGLPWDPAYSSCNYGDLASARHALLWGDSHAAQFSPLLDVLGKRQGVHVFEFSTPGCPPLFDGRELGINPAVCAHFRTEVTARAASFDTIVLAGRWDVPARDPDFANQLRTTLRMLTSTGKNVIVLAQAPLFTSNVAKLYIDGKLFHFDVPNHSSVNPDAARANAIVKRTVAEFPRVMLVDPTAELCTSRECSTEMDGMTLFYDDNHLSITGARVLAERLVRQGWRLFPASR